MIGIANTTKYLNDYHHQRSDAPSYTYYGYNGYIYDDASGSAYSETFTTGDEIGVYLDMTKQTLWFTKNGKNLGNARTDINKNLTYRLCVNLYTQTDEVKFVSYNNLLDEQKEETKENVNSNYIEKSTEFIIKQCKHLENELSN